MSVAGPIIGQEYTVVEPETLISNGGVDTCVPIGYDDTGNLRVDLYGDRFDGRTMLWNVHAFDEHIEDGVVVVRG